LARISKLVLEIRGDLCHNELAPSWVPPSPRVEHFLLSRIGGVAYVFSITRSLLSSQPWRTGTVYLLPRSTFITQPPLSFGAYQDHIAQLASLVPVQPLAKLTVTPADFPFLTQIRGHDDERLQEYATAMQTGTPWPQDI